MAQKTVLRNRNRLAGKQIFNRAVVLVTTVYLTALGLIFYFNTYTSDLKADALNGYKFRKAIQVDSMFVAGTNDISNYMMLVQHRDPSLKHVIYGGHVEDMNGMDIRFTDETGKQELPFEIETYNATSGNITAWVQVPLLHKNKKTTIYIYYGNSVSTGNGTEHAWNRNFKAVYHFENDSSDASLYKNTAINFGSKNAVGKFGNGRQFDGIDDYIAINYTSELSINDSITISAWIKPSMLSKTWQCIIGKQFGQSYLDNVFLGIDGKTKSAVFYTYECGVHGLKNELKADEWYQLTGVSNEEDRILYINGVEVIRNKKCNNPWLKDVNPIHIGAQENHEIENELNDWYTGIIDEVRIQNACLSSEVIKTEYYNYSDPEQFYSLGKEEQFSSSSVQLLYFKSDVLKENTIQIEWATASEINNKEYQLLRVNDKDVFEVIETVPAGKGNELEIYKVVDTNPLPGENQYKLIQQNTSGQINTFGPIKIENNFNNKIIGDLRLMSSPSSKNVNLLFNCSKADEMNLTLKGSGGKTILTSKIITEAGANNIELKTDDMFENGLYVIQFDGPNINPITAKVVKF